MAWIPGTRGVLLDVDGTLLLGEAGAPGAAQVLRGLRAARIPFRLTTNTTRKSRAAVARALRGVGIDVSDAEVLAPSILARRRILESGNRRTLLLVTEDACADFDGVEPTLDGHADWVVVGDLGAGFTWEILNRAFHALRSGARLLALQKNRYWHAGADGILIDAGPFVAALEYAADVQAEILGKPSRAFFELALAVLGLEPRDVLVVGDDVENDGRGGARAGCRTALVCTGKFSDAALAASDWRPDLLLDAVGDLGPPST
jgi:HAD superfamily hydrolase (TIGR01458 family)